MASVYEFGPFVFEPPERRLSREGTNVPLKPKIFDLLVALVERHGHLVTKQELLDTVWANTFVEEGNLTYSISTLRKALGDGQHGTRYIETVATRGYRFVAPVRCVETVVDSKPPTRWWQRRGPRLAFVAGATSTVALAMLLAMTGRQSTAPAGAAPVPAMFSIPLPDALHAVTPQHWPFVSPDGTTLAVLMTEPMGTRQRVWLRPLHAEDGAFLDGCEGAQFLEWSPDSTRLVCSVPKEDLQVLDLADGSQQAFCIACGGAAGKMAWSRRGPLLFHSGGSIFAVVEGGRPVLVTAPDRRAGEVERALPQFLPDGEHLTFWVQSDHPQRQGLYLARLDVSAAMAASRMDGGNQPSATALLSAERRLQEEIPALYADGHIVYSHGGDILVRPFDPMTRHFVGSPAVVLPERAWMRGRLGGVVALGLSETGTLVFSKIEHPLTHFQWIDRQGQRMGPVAEPGRHVSFDLSPDGRRLVVATLEDARAGLWTYELERGSASRTTFTAHDFDTAPRWLPDGRRVIVGRMDRLPSPLLFRLHLVAENGDVHALDAPAGCFPDAVTPDGRYVLCRTNAIVAVPLGDAPLLEVYRPRTGVLGRADVSPDAKWIAYGASESGRREVYVTSLAPGGERRIVSVDGGVQPRWRRDGRELFYIGLDGVLYAVGVTIDATGRPTFSLPTRLFATGLVSPSNLVEQYAPEGDGRRFLFLLPLDQRVRRSVGVLQHWPEIVRQPAASP